MLRTTIVDGLTQEGCPPVVAELAAQRVIAQLQAVRGATNIYIASNRQQRDKQILEAWQKCDGSKKAIKEIAKQYNVHTRTVYRVRDRAQKKNKQTNKQPTSTTDSFGSAEWEL